MFDHFFEVAERLAGSSFDTWLLGVVMIEKDNTWDIQSRTKSYSELAKFEMYIERPLYRTKTLQHLMKQDPLDLFVTKIRPWWRWPHLFRRSIAWNKCQRSFWMWWIWMLYKAEYMKIRWQNPATNAVISITEFFICMIRSEAASWRSLWWTYKSGRQW